MPLPNFLTALSVKQITVSELLQGWSHPVVLVDVRSLQHHTDDHISQSVWIPLEEIIDGNGVEHLTALVHAHHQPSLPEPMVILYCTMCPGALRAYRYLQSTGLQLVVLSGGLTAWRQKVSIAQEADALANLWITAQNLSRLGSHSLPPISCPSFLVHPSLFA